MDIIAKPNSHVKLNEPALPGPSLGPPETPPPLPGSWPARWLPARSAPLTLRPSGSQTAAVPWWPRQPRRLGEPTGQPCGACPSHATEGGRGRSLGLFLESQLEGTELGARRSPVAYSGVQWSHPPGALGPPPKPLSWKQSVSTPLSLFPVTPRLTPAGREECKGGQTWLRLPGRHVPQEITPCTLRAAPEPPSGAQARGPCGA